MALLQICAITRIIWEYIKKTLPFIYTNMLHGTRCENAEVIGTHPDMDSTNVQRLARPDPLTHWEGLTLTPLLLPLGNSSVVLSVTLYGQQDGRATSL